MIRIPDFTFSVAKTETGAISHLLGLIMSGNRCSWDCYVINVEQLNHGARVTIRFTGAPKEQE